MWARDRANARVIDASRRRGPAAARNAGVATSRGDFLAFCDADDVVSRSWLRELVAEAADADLVGGSFETTMLNSEKVRARFDLLDPAEPHLGFLPAAAGGNLGIWHDVFLALGGFEERRRTGEDVALVWRAQLLGYRYRPCRSAGAQALSGGPAWDGPAVLRLRTGRCAALPRLRVRRHAPPGAGGDLDPVASAGGRLPRCAGAGEVGPVDDRAGAVMRKAGRQCPPRGPVHLDCHPPMGWTQ